MEHVVATHAHVPRKNVACGVTFGMPDVEPGTAGVREHVENVELGFGGVFGNTKCLVFIPIALPLFFDTVEWVGGRHSVLGSK
ncbi:hypothetical protein HRbin20_01666 [bacterium HR20]|nr:hypothetical protein HRbin20_01666 [bacterium HR20]